MNAWESWKGGNRTRVNRLGTTIALATIVAVLLSALFGIALATDPTAQASRTIDPNVVEPGDEVAIKVVFKNVLNVTKSFALKEVIPDGWGFTPGSDDGGTRKDVNYPTIEWIWFMGVSPGATKTVTYTLTVPVDAEAGNYTIEGTVTGAEVENPVGGDATITVRVFHNLTISSTAGGSVASPGEGTFAYDTGTVVNLAAVADEGYRFDQWTGSVSTIVDVYQASTTIVMNGDYNITASFIAVYDLTTNSTEGGSVTDPGEGTFAYDEGTVIDLVAVADACYEFINWTGDVGTIADADTASTNITMNGDYSITANFALIDCDYRDYYGVWEFYCVGDEVWKHQRFHDFSCVNGTCVEVSGDYVNDQFVQNCTALDYYTDWVYYCNGTSIWRTHDFHDYYCFDGTCQEDVIPESEWYEDCPADYYTDWVYYCNGTSIWRMHDFHDYYCFDGTCQEDVIPESEWYEDCPADYYTDWVYYCNGTSIWRMHDFHDYYCFDGTCQEDVIPESEWYEDCPADYYTDWVYYCNGTSIWRMHDFHDYYCFDGTCQEDVIPESEWYEDCPADYYTDWVYYCNGTSIWRMHDFHDYYCFDGTCQEDVIPESEWYEDCDDGDPCTVDTCENGVCVHTPIYADILEYYQGLYGNPDEVSTLELLAAADDWIADVVPPCFEEPITTLQLLQLADEWISSG